MTTEEDAQPLIPEQISNEILAGIVEDSAALSLFRRMPNMTSRTLKMPVLDSLGAAHFATGTKNDDVTAIYAAITANPNATTDEVYSGNENPFVGKGELDLSGVPEMKLTHQMKWDNVWITAEPLAIILPIGEDVLEDSAYPIWEEVKPRIIEAFNAQIDRAIIWGQGRPTTWPMGIVPGCAAKGTMLREGDNVDNVDVAHDISDLMFKIEEKGYNPSGFMGAIGFKNQLRKLRDLNDALLFQPSLQAGTPDTLYGLPINFPKNNVFNSNIAKLIVGDMDQAVYSIRQDIRFKVFTEGVVQDTAGNIIFNLMQNDMVALRVTMRLGWAIPNPIHALRGTRSDAYPFATLLPPVAAGGAP